ncbi:metalloregulator ArsR/SmtB family transcription factor [Sutcliffiella horikoshii]|uniref:ArsR/SmtB family transcription factor n=1 Tax=Sutcliffiella horikoshii TaxID=79883 RepID=UPI00384D6CE4
MTQEAIDVFRSCIPLFTTLSDPARQDIILLLAEHENLSVGEIANTSSLSRSAISHHLKILKDNRLVQMEQKGTMRYYSLTLDTGVNQLKALVDIVESDCMG